MQTIDWYLDRARERHNLSSDTALAVHLRISRPLITQWRTKRCWPTGAAMERLADACGIDRELALAQLGSWREPEVSAWRTMAERLGKSAALVALFFIFPGDGGTAHAAATALPHALEHGKNIAPLAPIILYIMRQKLARLRRRISGNLRLLQDFLLLRHNHAVLVPA